MKTPGDSQDIPKDAPGQDPIAAYLMAQSPEIRSICDVLQELIESVLPKASPKVWHGGPVWFIDDNPVVGYKASKHAVTLLFWNGQAFDDPGLKTVGKHRAAQTVFKDVAEIDSKLIRRWLKKSKSNVLDSKALMERLKEGK